jgi:Fic family protein
MLANRTYLGTHPWITFDLETYKFPARLWMLLGEAASKAKHIAGVPLAPQTAERFHLVFLAKGARATTAIEGNTLTEIQVQAQVRGTLTVPPSQKYLQQEVKNIIDACNWLREHLQGNGSKKITPEFCCELNARVLRDLQLEDGIAAQDAYGTSHPAEVTRENHDAAREDENCERHCPKKHLLPFFLQSRHHR